MVEHVDFVLRVWQFSNRKKSLFKEESISKKQIFQYKIEAETGQGVTIKSIDHASMPRQLIRKVFYFVGSFETTCKKASKRRNKADIGREKASVKQSWSGLKFGIAHEVKR